MGRLREECGSTDGVDVHAPRPTLKGPSPTAPTPRVTMERGPALWALNKRGGGVKL